MPKPDPLLPSKPHQVDHEQDLEHLDEEERQEEKLVKLLRANCPRLQWRLFLALWEQPPREEREVIESVYRLNWRGLSKRAQGRYRARLRQLQKALNDRLLQHKPDFHIERDRGVLSLDKRRNPDREPPPWARPAAAPTASQQTMTEEEAQAAIKKILASLPPEVQRRIEQQEARQPANQRARLTECSDLIAEYLTCGPKGSEELADYCAARGYRPGTIRRARKRLHLETYREGFGGEGRWFVQLPPAGCNNSQSGPSAHL